jgi:hypothetical protein
MTMIRENIKQSFALGVAVVYLFFSCLYVIQCLKTTRSADFIKITRSISKADATHALIASVKGHDRSACKFLSRPRVIINKNTLFAPLAVLALCLICFCLSLGPDKSSLAFISKSDHHTTHVQALLQTWRL